MVAPLLQGHVVRKMAVIGDVLCIVDIEKTVSLQRCIPQTGRLGI